MEIKLQIFPHVFKPC